MSLTVRIGFLQESARADFVARFLPRLPGSRLTAEETAEEGDEAAYAHRVVLGLSSPTAARELCQQLVAFLNHHKGSGVHLEWSGAEGKQQTAQLAGAAAKDAERVAVRLGAAARASKDAVEPREPAAAE
jgi:hypothetical protein